MSKEYNKYLNYGEKFVLDNMMGPNSIVTLESMLQNVSLKKGMRVLDLGCGRGLTSIYLAKEYDVEVYAMDLWINKADNKKRFIEKNVDTQIVSVQADATKSLPFEENYFDALISVDAYHYFGYNEEYYDTFISRCLKPGATVCISIPGMKIPVNQNIPSEMKIYWPEDALKTWRTCEEWRQILSLSSNFRISEITEMNCFDMAWNTWLRSNNKFARSDQKMITVDNGRYMNLIQIIGKNQIL